MLSPSTRAKLAEELQAFEQSDSTQLIILTIPSLEGDALEDFSIKAAEVWKIGQKGKDNGIILLVSKGDRKIRIEVGKGLEGKLTDLMAGRIIDLVITPRFKRGDMDGGILAGVSALIDATRGEFKAEPQRHPSRSRGSSPFLSFLIFYFVITLILGSISRIFGGVIGAIGLPALVHLTLFPLGLIPLILLALLGLAGGSLLPALFLGRGLHGGSGAGPGGWFYGSGGGWGSSSGGGDFGGGGGGDFGGGGASGDW